jgi:cell division protein ZapA (FtsZ GTPase activity inhibitor)
VNERGKTGFFFQTIPSFSSYCLKDSAPMIQKTSQLLTLALLLLTACYQAADLENFDEAAFQSDPQGCEGVRLEMREQILQLPKALQGITQQKIEATLGKADRQELSNRSQKYLYYYIEPGPACENAEEEPFTMIVRFNSVGQANEISFQNY